MHRIIVKLREAQIHSELYMGRSRHYLHSVTESPLFVDIYFFYSAVLFL